jgi:uncharacterized protein
MTTADLNPESAPFWAGCAEGELRFQRCQDCGEAIFSPRSLCPNCSSLNLRWERASGCGRIYSYSVVHRDAGEHLPAPYVFALVDLDEGFRMMTNIVDAADSDLAVGADVIVEFRRREGTDRILPLFRLAPPTARRAAGEQQ